jgi:hypothetical protein
VLPISGTTSPVGRAALAMLLFEDIALVPIIFLLGAMAPAAAGGIDAMIRTLWQGGLLIAVLLGAGGSARGIAVALLEAGCPEVVLVNRTRARAELLAREIGGPVRVADTAPLAEAALLVNTTSLGMAGQPPLELDLAPLPANAVVADIVYVPLETLLLRAARARGLLAVPGLGMLLHQARPGFAAWFGVDPVVDAELAAFVGGDIPAAADRAASQAAPAAEERSVNPLRPSP